MDIKFNNFDDLEDFRRRNVFLMHFIMFITVAPVIACAIWLQKYSEYIWIGTLGSAFLGFIVGTIAYIINCIWVNVSIKIVMILLLIGNIIGIYNCFNSLSTMNLLVDIAPITFMTIVMVGTYFYTMIHYKISTTIKNNIFEHCINYKHEYGNDKYDKLVLDAYKNICEKYRGYAHVNECFFGSYKNHEFSLFECILSHPAGRTTIQDFTGVLFVANMEFLQTPQNSNPNVFIDNNTLYYWIPNEQDNFEVFVYKPVKYSAEKASEIIETINNIITIIDNYTDYENNNV